MKNYLIAPLVVLMLALSPAFADVILISDIVDNAEGWVNIPASGTGQFTAVAGGLTPQAGTSFYYADASISGTGNRGISKYFTGTTFLSETYTLTVTYDVGDLDTAGYSPGNSFLMADFNNDGIYSYNERVIPSSTSRTAPLDGEWSGWTDTYNITATTTNANGDLIAGTTMGFFFISTVGTGNAVAFDNLVVMSSIPEPATAGLLLTGLGLVVVRRKHFARR